MNLKLLEALLERRRTHPDCPMLRGAYYNNPPHNSMQQMWWSQVKAETSLEDVMKKAIVITTLEFDFEVALTAEFNASAMFRLHRECMNDLAFKPLVLQARRVHDPGAGTSWRYQLVCPTQGDAIMAHAHFDDFKL